ncbi:MAG: hypothetical protein IKR28_05970 [Selenomonadaceae bacterium]|nr:hypothetical protein [Selenomonadaceae bacterium]
MAKLEQLRYNQQGASDVSARADNAHDLALACSTEKAAFSPFRKRFGKAVREESLEKMEAG